MGIGYIRQRLLPRCAYPPNLLYYPRLYFTTPHSIKAHLVKHNKPLLHHVSGPKRKEDLTINGLPKMITNLSPIKMIL